MLEGDDVTFDDWDQDQTAIDEDYGSQDPAAVSAQVVDAAELVASTYQGLTGDQWDRRGARSNGDAFTVDTLGRYHLHDLVHHAHDVSHITKRVTVASYEASAEDYRGGTEDMPDSVREALEAFAATLPEGARVLEIGSGPGRDARMLEEHGVSVRRTDITAAFVRMLRADGHDADVVDPLTDDLSDPTRDEPYDAVWASASLLHARREDLPRVLANLAAVTREDGPLRLALKEGDGARFSTHGNVSGPRHFTFWREPALREVLEHAGWSIDRVERTTDKRDQDWLDVHARRSPGER
jgi:SAM-dependent methyltransferase